MQCISRKEQQRITIKLQEDFDHLVRNANQQAIMFDCAITQAESLLREINDINKNRFFEEDLRESLDDCATKIMHYIQRTYPSQLRSSAPLPKHKVHIISLIDLKEKLYSLLRVSSPPLVQGDM